MHRTIGISQKMSRHSKVTEIPGLEPTAPKEGTPTSLARGSLVFKLWEKSPLALLKISFHLAPEAAAVTGSV